MVCFLLDQGADVNAKGGFYSNALQAASVNYHDAVVLLLLERGAVDDPFAARCYMMNQHEDAEEQDDEFQEPEVVDLFRVLVAKQPAAFCVDLARALNSLSLCLLDLGQAEEALTASQELVRLHRIRTANRPAAFIAYLEKALYNLSLCLTGLGRAKEVLALATPQDVVDLYRTLAQEWPEAFNDNK